MILHEETAGFFVDVTNAAFPQAAIIFLGKR